MQGSTRDLSQGADQSDWETVVSSRADGLRAWTSCARTSSVAVTGSNPPRGKIQPRSGGPGFVFWEGG